ncbi:hypothetical protein O9H85_05155 [Paenibacillus filicis]|uniref:Uncharacterized protein n=1 Tax=Paenibacillus gyeongsangnamensis TaxID=3388067 RepID=A0ABT4Q4N5_9BACL|nr:hypothetical protein [Paenibacillus filicis]MCZ8511818.1 hypothetical protein [Paenibacillus filicis]
MNNILLEYLCINIWIALMVVLLWVNDGVFSLVDRNIILLLSVAGLVHIRTKIKAHRKSGRYTE